MAVFMGGNRFCPLALLGERAGVCAIRGLALPNIRIELTC